MEGTRPSSQPRDVLRRIREFTLSIVEDLSNGRLPSICIDRFQNCCADSDGYCLCSYDYSKGKEVLELKSGSQAYRLGVLLQVLLIVQKLLQENRHASKRDIYYMHPGLFSEQPVVDKAIYDIGVILHCSRHNLNVVAVGKGLVMGWLRFSESGRKFDCINNVNTAHPVPVRVEEVKEIVAVALYILVVEKESVFQRLANDKFCSKNRCIIITGRGYPDVNTRRYSIAWSDYEELKRFWQNITIICKIHIIFYRLFSCTRFLRLLVEKLELPTFCLVDCDPYGFDILTTYRFGSMKMAHDAEFLRIPEIQWLGVFPSESEKYNIPPQCLLPLTAEDSRRTEGLLRRCYLQREVPMWRSELELMLQKGVKFEIEALSVHSISFLSEKYIPSKIHTGAIV
ncbi:hypothetical protein QQ045_014737 [Rhodiola kirilowii]